MNMSEVILTYVGTVLIAMEFIRKFTNLQALMGMLVGWPVSSFLKEKGLNNWFDIYKNHKISVVLRLTASVILCVITLPLTVLFYVIWFVVLCLNSFHNFINGLHNKGKTKYRPLYEVLIGLNLFAHKMADYKKYENVDEEQVMEEIEKGDIPILPIIGVVLITVAFVTYIL